MFVDRFNSMILTNEEKEKKKKIDLLTKMYVRSNERSREIRKLYGPNYR